METNLRKKISAFLKEKSRRSRWHRVLMALACVVVFATTYVLILPAITMTNENVCGLEEHTHDASCYSLEWVEAQPEFLCSDATHQHTKECWNEEGEQICGKTEVLFHMHDEACFFNGELICPLEEKQEHSHTEGCFEEGQRILCGQEEKIHHHTADCYGEAGNATASTSDATEAKVTCGYSEGEAEGHVHSSDCYESWSNLICEEEAISAHTHEASCLNEEGELTCGLKDTAEHVHSEECMVWPEDMDEDGMVQQEVLSCTLPEHSHTVACKALPEDKLICGFEEHEHDAACYDENKNLICEKTEHRHSMECLDLADWLDGDMDAIYVCGKAEHNHTELCYHEIEVATASKARRSLASASNATSSNSLERADGEPKKELDCGEEEHVHTLACLPPTIMTMALSPYGEFQESGVLETGHTWTVYRNELEEYTLVIEGEGDLPDFAYSNDMTEAPWSIYGTNTAGRGYHLVIGDDVTRIGAHAFRGQKILSVDFGSGVESIGEFAFRSSRTLGKTEPLKIPGNVKRIEASAFNSSELWAGIELSEGLEFIGSNAFSIGGNIAWENIHIPSTVKTIDATSFNNAASFTVAEDNPYYNAVDGVLYNKDITNLVAFPRRKVQDTYRTPDTVVEISSGALYSVRGVRKLVIGSQVAKGPNSLTMNSLYEEIIIEDGAGVATTSRFNSSFYGISNLKYLKLPDDVEFEMHHSFGSQWTYNSLTELYIPNGVTAITNRDDVGTTKMPNLEHLIYNAKNATIEDKNHLGNDTRYELLTIGKDVDYLPKNFYRFVNKATELRFEPDNFFTIEAGAFAGAPVPFDGLSGEIYVDKDGAVYSCKGEEASLIYLPPKLEKYTVLTSITGEDSKTYQVTKIEENAAKYADSLKEITFDTDYVKTLGAYALANCPQLNTVNGEQDYERLLQVLKKAGVELGVNAFYNTGLIGAPKPKDFEEDMDGKQRLQVKKDMYGNDTPDDFTIQLTGAENITPQWIKKGEDKDGEIGGYRLLTGETINITASVGSTDGGIHYRYRLYFRVTEDDVNISPMPQNGGDSVIFDDKQEVLYRATDDPYTFYLEWKPYDVGVTATIPLIVNYPNWTSDGGAVTVWGVVVPEEDTEIREATSHQKEVIESTSGTIQAYWTTEPVKYNVSKTYKSTNVNLTGIEDGSVRLSNNLQWSIQSSHDPETTSYGKDRAKSMEYVDSITFPQGLEWKEEILEGIQAGNVTSQGNDIYVGEVRVATIARSSNQSGGGTLEWDGEKPVFRFNKLNNSKETEMGEDIVNLTVYTEAIAVDLQEFSTAKDGHIITNNVDETVHFQFSEDQKRSASAASSIVPQNPAIRLTKESTTATFFGEDITYTLKLQNPGTSEYKSNNPDTYVLRDVLDGTEKQVWIKPANMEKMFEEAEATGEKLTITIKAATLAEWKEVVGKDGEEKSWQHAGNSDRADKVTGAVIAITKIGNEYQAVVTSGVTWNGTYTDSTVEALLQKLGYAVTKEAQYICDWALVEGKTHLTLGGGETHTYHIYATAKDTFSMLSKDWPVEYEDSASPVVRNSARVVGVDANDKETNNIASASSQNINLKREAIIDKQLFTVSENEEEDGKNITSRPSASDGSELKYTLTFTHYGSGDYKDLPMVDDLYGDQYLLVPVEYNKENETLKNTPTYESPVDKKEYYVLDFAGTFTNVVVGEDEEGNLLTAASITVDKKSGSTNVGGNEESYTGAHTEIKWYYPTLPGERYSISVDYKTLVEFQGQGGQGGGEDQLTYTIGNVVWMNDREGDRIFDSLWGGGSVIDFDKQIVTDMKSEDNFTDDILSTEGAGKYEEGRYSVIKKGKNGKGTSVTYRLLFHNTGSSKYKLSGKYIADALPNTRGKFKWEIGKNVKFSGIVNKNNATVHAMDKWSLTDKYGENNLGEEAGTQFIVWPEDSYVEFDGNGTLAIYITLTFPTNDEEGEATWDLYEEENDGRVLKNTLYVYDFPVSVSHDLESAGRPMLQKGVYRLAQSQTSPATSYDRVGTDLKQYSNRDGKFQSVVYYVALHNDGHSRMYLSDLQDLLPRGFTYVQMITNSNESNVSLGTVQEIQTLGGTYADQPTILVEMQSEDGTEITYRTATIRAGTTKREDGRQQITFSFGAGSGDYPVKYDEELQKYYLDKGEGIVFGYIANVGYADETDDEAWNVIGMPYTDYLEVGLTKQSNTKFNNTHDKNYSAPNDGYRYIESETEVKEKYGFEAQNESTSEEEQQWLTSDVRVERGSIVPGITKYTDSYSNNGWAIPSGREEYTASVYGSSTVYWRVKLTNTGSTSLTDYTVRDVMPYPYVFEGTVYYTIKDSQGNIMPSTGNMEITEEGYTLITFPEKRTGTEESMSVKNGYTHTGTNVTVNFKGDEWFDLASSGLSDYQIAFAMERVGNAAGQLEEVLKLHFEGGKVAIPAGGEAEIVFASRNPTNTYVNTVYINHAELTPNKQSFTDAGQGSIIYGEDGKPETVRAFSPVTVNGAYTTDSVKSIVEKNNPENQANSRDPENNYILLSQPDSVFRYTLTVENNTNEAMQRLVLIDNLPSGTDDHMPFSTTTDRGSEFSVRLSDTPNFEAKITMPVENPDTGETTIETYRLEPSQNYSVEYASTTDFGDRQSNDWHGRGGELDSEYPTTAEWKQIDLDVLRPLPGEDEEEEVPELIGTLSKEVVNNAKALRIVVRSSRQITLVAGAKLEFSFDAVVEENTEDPASPGEIAWNNFGYHYHLQGSGTDVHLEAMPLVVGVRIPAVPILEKRLVNAQGIEVEAEKEETFPFLVYEGAKLEGEYKTSEEWKAALNAAGRDYYIYELTVPKGASTSGKIKLLADEEAGWEWEDGATYTMTELSENEDYAFNDFNHFTQTGSENSLTFQYDKDKDDKITFSCYNKLLSWNVEGTKVGDNGATGLGGAVFALYGPTQTSPSISEEYKDLDIATTMDVDDTTWYLYDVQTTDGAGNFTWRGLKEDAYYLWEVKAPDRFNFSERNRGMILNRTDTHGGVTYSFKVTNYASFEFPETGGTGRHPFTTVGLSLMAGTVLMYLYYHKRRKEDKTS